jgi:DNA-binding XRE family transcriptional regulator
LVATKVRPIERLFRHDTPSKVLERLDQAFGFWFVRSSTDDELVNPFETFQWKNWEAAQTPGAWLSGLREAHGWTQRELGERLGGVSPARISDWEHDRRAISKEVAKQLSSLLHVSVERFL